MSLEGKMVEFDVKSGLTLSYQELCAKLLYYKKELFFIKLQINVTRDSDKNAQLKVIALKKVIARILTCINDKNKKK